MPYTPPITSGLRAILDPTNLALTDGAAVTSWSDPVGGSTITVSGSPTFRSPSFGLFPGVRVTSASTIAATSSGANGTTFIVTRWVSGTGDLARVSNVRSYAIGSGNVLQYYNGTATGPLGPALSPGVSTIRNLDCRFNSTQAQSGSTAAVASGTVQFGGYATITADLLLMLVYSTVLTDAQCQTIESHILQYFGISASTALAPPVIQRTLNTSASSSLIANVSLLGIFDRAPAASIPHTSVTVTYQAEGASSATSVSMSAGTLGAWSSGGWVATSTAGVYQLGIPNAATPSEGNTTTVTVSVSGCYTVELRVYKPAASSITIPDGRGFPKVDASGNVTPTATNAAGDEILTTRNHRPGSLAAVIPCVASTSSSISVSGDYRLVAARAAYCSVQDEFVLLGTPTYSGGNNRTTWPVLTTFNNADWVGESVDLFYGTGVARVESLPTSGTVSTLTRQQVVDGVNLDDPTGQATSLREEVQGITVDLTKLEKIAESQ